MGKIIFVFSLLLILPGQIAMPAPPRAKLAIVANCIICGYPVTNAAYRYPGTFNCGCEDRELRIAQTTKEKEEKEDEEVSGSLVRISALIAVDPGGR